MSMNIPRDGRAVIIDDEPKEALPLIRVLAKNGVPITYFTAEFEELPEQPLDGVRLVFLDLKLIPSIEPKMVISTLVNTLSRIVNADNGPYFIILWSKHEPDYKKAFEDKFNQDEELERIKPLAVISLEKDTYIERDGKEIRFNDDAIHKIEIKLKEKLQELGIYHLFVIWENLVHRSTGKIVHDFADFYRFDEKWNENMSSVFLKLAEGFAGKQLDKSDAGEIIKNSLFSFNSAFMDTLESEIRSYDSETVGLSFNDVSKDVSEKIVGAINTKLLLAMEKSESILPLPGNVYRFSDIYEGEDPHQRSMIYEFIDPNQMQCRFFKQKNVDIESMDGKEQKQLKREFDEYFKKVRNQINDVSKMILVEVSPYCDYAQNKWKISRIIKGFLWPYKQEFEGILKRADFSYISPIIYIIR